MKWNGTFHIICRTIVKQNWIVNFNLAPTDVYDPLVTVICCCDGHRMSVASFCPPINPASKSMIFRSSRRCTPSSMWRKKKVDITFMFYSSSSVTWGAILHQHPAYIVYTTEAIITLCCVVVRFISCSPILLGLGTLHRLDWTDDGQLLTVSTISGEHGYMIVTTVTVSCVLHYR